MVQSDAKHMYLTVTAIEERNLWHDIGSIDSAETPYLLSATVKEQRVI